MELCGVDECMIKFVQSDTVYLWAVVDTVILHLFDKWMKVTNYSVQIKKGGFVEERGLTRGGLQSSRKQPQ